MSPWYRRRFVRREGFPRVSGDEPCAELFEAPERVFSPRGWG